MTDDVVGDLSQALTDAGIRERVEQRATAHLDNALAALASTSIAPAATAELASLARFVVERKH